jgi:mRNA interferase HigB
MLLVRIIKPSTVRVFARQHPAAAAGLGRWLELVKAARWRTLHDVRRVFRSADEVRVASGRAVVVFNIAGNQFRLIAAIHYNLEKVFVLRFMTHAEYSKNRWKDLL